MASRGFPNAIEPQPDWWSEEQPLIPCDNLIIGNASRYKLARSKPFEEFLQDHVAGTLATFCDALIQNGLLQPNENEGPVFDPAEYKLGDIEFYWEFDHPTPITFVDTLTHFLPRVAKQMRVTKKDIDRTTREVSFQSQSATIYLTRKRQLRVYAKTNRRIRFEVEFPSGYRSTAHTRSTYNSFADFRNASSNLAREAADTLNKVLENLWGWVEPHELDATPEELRAAIVAASNDPFIATTLIHNLARWERIALSPGDPLRDTVRRLATGKSAVLRTLKSDRSIYVVTRRYEYARRQLGRV
ncbi:hypothetical protein C1J05_03320 [Sulfitobacter sp. JL08]|nr:hypothetical protein C1J05_03320 [Sulfitobacter sp. JL08]